MIPLLPDHRSRPGLPVLRRSLRRRPLLRRALLLGCGLSWFALELLLARMVHPARTLRCFRILWLFLRAERCTRPLLDPLLAGSRGRRSELKRYARNCIVLVALQPECGGNRIEPESAWVVPAALFGACIPLYDGCLDQLPTRQARALVEATGEALAAANASESGDLSGLAPILGRCGAAAEDAASWATLISALGSWLGRQSPERRHLVLEWMGRMNDAQLASLDERNITLGLNECRRLSSLKGGVSFLLLRCLCLPEEGAPTGATEQGRAALLQAAAVAQWIDDYADLANDLSLGIHTYIGRLEASGRAIGTIRQGLRQVAIALRREYGSGSELFIDSLSLYFAIKRSGRLRARLEQALNR